jgi:hypothetical protein
LAAAAFLGSVAAAVELGHLGNQPLQAQEMFDAISQVQRQSSRLAS